MTVRTVATSPIDGQQPGTSGLRRQARVFMQPCHPENVAPSLLDAAGGPGGGSQHVRYGLGRGVAGEGRRSDDG